ncbi:hypothetical protein RHMOL_Rhmol03G0155800 [Rhododendron molle]|uniref:Uncharacterized protein n=1 Tax=Rhododendron molle TaxID=49168 RepID=A0ACC0PEL5_RHOML|nr:hypothetical protein RHMOL_Rhmol03G0155800 [Rhododendron molle]
MLPYAYWIRTRTGYGVGTAKNVPGMAKLYRVLLVSLGTAWVRRWYAVGTSWVRFSLDEEERERERGGRRRRAVGFDSSGCD